MLEVISENAVAFLLKVLGAVGLTVLFNIFLS